MNISNLGFCFFVFFHLFGIKAQATGSAFSKIELPDGSSRKRFGFFIFGDSYLDAGNNNYIVTPIDKKSNFRPYGESFFPIPTGRFTDGRIIPDFLAEYAGLPYIKPYLEPNNTNYMNGVSFASAAGGVLAETHSHEAIGLITQMEFFRKVEKSLRKKLGNEGSQTFLSNSVFLFSFGGNDYLNPLDFGYEIYNTIEAQRRMVNMVIGNFTIALKEIYKRGGRKFGFITVPPVGYTPNTRMLKSEQFFQESSSIASLHNKLLLIAIKKLATQLHGLKYAFADVHTLLLQKIQNPAKYGFKVVDTACCGGGDFRGYPNCGRNIGTEPYTHCTNLEDYLYYDCFHPTEKAFEQISKAMWSGGEDIVKPYNLKQLFDQYDSTLAERDIIKMF